MFHTISTKLVTPHYQKYELPLLNWSDYCQGPNTPNQDDSAYSIYRQQSHIHYMTGEMTQETKQRKEKERAEEVEGEEEEKEKRRRSTCSRERRRLRRSMAQAPAADRRDRAEQWKGFPNIKKRKGDGRWRLVWERDVKRNSFPESFEKQSRERKRGREESSSFV